MKFCKRRRLTYINVNNITTTTDYVTLGDVIAFHGETFTNQWKDFIKNSKTFKVNEQSVYYYAEYKTAAMTTHMYLDLI